uniref:Uncharacterized protein n=1 Tax=Meloidogyne enterolobii TaxID=390850 RepID=A0A6V7XCY9_MELEN|nr:unnamed protein product [Meloidogyne enterolobii]
MLCNQRSCCSGLHQSGFVLKPVEADVELSSPTSKAQVPFGMLRASFRRVAWVLVAWRNVPAMSSSGICLESVFVGVLTAGVWNSPGICLEFFLLFGVARSGWHFHGTCCFYGTLITAHQLYGYAMPLRIVQQQQTKKKHKRRRNSKINKKKNNKSKRTIYSSPKIKRIVCLVVTKIKVEEKLKERINNPTTTTVN